MYFVSCPKQGLEMEAVVLHRVRFLEYFCPKQGQDFKPSAAPLYPNMGQETPPPPGLGMRFAIWNLDLAIFDFAFFNNLSGVRTGN